MDYSLALKKINDNEYSRIIVTGPQRSGTRFTTNALAFDLEYSIIDELDFEIGNMKKFKQILSSKENIVIQAPSLSNYVHNFKFENTVVVFMYRNIQDIINSQNRIGSKNRNRLITWTETHERTLKLNIIKCFNSNKKIDWTKQISHIKYQVWEKIQKPLMKMDMLDLEYETLNNHPMWIIKNNRKEFKPNQIK